MQGVENVRFRSGSCGGMYTANTARVPFEALAEPCRTGPHQKRHLAAKMDDCRRAGAAVWRCCAQGIKPLDILTKNAFENAITVVSRWRSTNEVCTCSPAHTAGVKLALDVITRIGKTRARAGPTSNERQTMMSEIVAIGGIRH